MQVKGLLVCLIVFLLLGCMSNKDWLTAPDLRLSFVIDKEFDKTNVLSMFRSYTPAGLENRAKGMGVELNLAREIRDADPTTAEKLASKLVEDRFARDGAAIQGSRDYFEDQWKHLLPLFSQLVVELTESPWVHREYLCVISCIHRGLSNWNGNKVAVHFDFGRSFNGKVLAEEITLSDVFQLLRKRHPKEEINDWQVWAYSEITASLILNDPKFEALWPNTPILSNYHQLTALRPKLTDLFVHRTSYVDYEDKAVPLLQGFDPRDPVP